MGDAKWKRPGTGSASGVPAGDTSSIPVISGVKTGRTGLAVEDDTGEVIIVHIQPEVENGKAAVVVINGDAWTVKRFFRYPDRLELWPDNQQIPKTVIRGKELLQTFV